MDSPQQIMSHVSVQPQTSSTVTTRPHTSHAKDAPFDTPALRRLVVAFFVALDAFVFVAAALFVVVRLLFVSSAIFFEPDAVFSGTVYLPLLFPFFVSLRGDLMFFFPRQRYVTI
jgi:hypothetical protein